MKIKPIILDRITTKHTNYYVDLMLDSNVTFVAGDSGVGKSAVYSFLQEYSSEDKRVRCLNYLDYNKQYKNAIKSSKGKLFVIDNADLLLDDKMRQHIALDNYNQYIIIGRNPTALMLSQDEILELDSKNSDGITHFYLKKAFGDR
ncbi:hypothetical protein [Butyrivibrio sp. AE2032]|uniref:hypothetical protein n=1 Tax=Butyrivibrio sp. AE2032 TaxID=1458463 RepID=UPI0005578C9D|nr:hypothetical protein [Butyrivibrio sp. AE2032]